MRHLTSLLSILLATSLHILAAAPSSERSHVVLVKPVILCDDDGQNPARHALPKKLVDQVYTRGDLEFLYLEPVHWNHGKARRGEINLDTIVNEGHANGMIVKDPRMVTLLFVSAVDGITKRLGRGLQGGNICFVNLGRPDEMQDPAERAFVVAHEVGHCLGMIHAINDLKAPNDVPNLQGDGPFAERLAVEGLHPSQVKTLRRSPLVQARLHFQTRQETTASVCEDPWDLPLETLTLDNLRFELGLPPSSPLPENPAERLTFAKEKYAELATEFSAPERDQLGQWVRRINALTAKEWPVIGRVPWRFAKMSESFCKGRPHTRGLAIVLTDTAMKRFQTNEHKAMEVLLHEKLHVIQRLMPQRFEAAFKRYGYESIKPSKETAHQLNFVRNPDAPVSKWAIRQEDRLLLLATSLETKGEDFRFIERAYPIHDNKLEDALPDTSTLDDWRAGFPIPVGHDHPREVSAYAHGRIFRMEMLKDTEGILTPKQSAFLQEERQAFAKTLAFPATE